MLTHTVRVNNWRRFRARARGAQVAREREVGAALHRRLRSMVTQASGVGGGVEVGNENQGM